MCGAEGCLPGREGFIFILLVRIWFPGSARVAFFEWWEFPAWKCKLQPSVWKWLRCCVSLVWDPKGTCLGRRRPQNGGSACAHLQRSEWLIKGCKETVVTFWLINYSFRQRSENFLLQLIQICFKKQRKEKKNKITSMRNKESMTMSVCCLGKTYGFCVQILPLPGTQQFSLGQVAYLLSLSFLSLVKWGQWNPFPSVPRELN